MPTAASRPTTATILVAFLAAAASGCDSGDGYAQPFLTIHADAATTPPLGTLHLSATGRSGPSLTWALSRNASGGTVSAAGVYTAGPTGDVTDEVRVVDSEQNQAFFTIEVTSGVSIAADASSAPPRGTVILAASGGSGAGYVWTLATNASGGAVSEAGVYTAGATGAVADVVRVVDSLGNVAVRTVAVTPGIAIDPPAATTPPRGSVSLAASGGGGIGFAWTLGTNASGGSITPEGLYTAGSTGDVVDLVQVTDLLGNVAERAIDVTAGVSIAGGSSTPPRGAVDLAASGGSGAGFTWSLQTNGSGGSVSAGRYTAGATGAVADVVRVEDSLGNVAVHEVAVTAGLSIVSATAVTPPRGSLQLAAAGGSGAGLAWSLAPSGSGGSISQDGRYTAGVTGEVSDVVRVEDSLGNVATLEVAVTAGVSIVPAAVTTRALRTVPFAATGGSGSGFAWSLATNASGGAITPGGVYTSGTNAGVADVVRVQDSLGNVALGTVQVERTPIPTPPEGLPPIAGLSSGYHVVPSAGMTPPATATVPIPRPVGGTIVDQDAAIRLGKALFWDAQVGSDGLTACASCHFRAGTDGRLRNTVHPGPDLAFQVVPGPGATWVPVSFTADDRIGSSGVLSRAFTGIAADLADPEDVCEPARPGDPAQQPFFDAGERLVTGRNAPTTVGAVFNRDNFWDGRARHRFNGENPLGEVGGAGPFVENASLASQAVGPPLSEVEMSCAGRPFNGPSGLGAKLVPRTPLAYQRVHPLDSALGPLANAPGDGLRCGFGDRLCTYADLIAAAFGTGGLEGEAAVAWYVASFSSIFGQAIQAYEATLVPDRTPYDLGMLTSTQVAGLEALRERDCMTCHAEPEFTDATVRFFVTGPANDNGSDKGYHNIGASPTAADLGRAASPGGTDSPSPANAGAFKTPTLRNVKLTAPYMHNGNLANLGAVLAFYDGEGQVPNPEIDDRAVGAGINRRDEAAVLDFLRNGLTDCRVEHELAPFDHPSLPIPNGPSLPAVGANGDGNAICP